MEYYLERVFLYSTDCLFFVIIYLWGYCMINLKEKFNFEIDCEKVIDFDAGRLCQACLIFLKFTFSEEKYKNIEILPLTLLFYDKIESNGLFYPSNSQCTIYLNQDNIKNQNMFNNELDSLFCVLLHELYHYLDFLLFYNTHKNGNKNVEKIYLAWIKSNGLHQLRIEKNKIKTNDLDALEKIYIKSAQIPSEFNAYKFSLEKLAIFEKIYKINDPFLAADI